MYFNSDDFGRGDVGGFGAGNVSFAPFAVAAAALGDEYPPGDDICSGGGGGGTAGDGEGGRSECARVRPLPSPPSGRSPPPLSFVSVTVDARGLDGENDAATPVAAAPAGVVREPSVRELEGLRPWPWLWLLRASLPSRLVLPVDDLRPPSSSLQLPDVPRGESDRSSVPPAERCLRMPVAEETVCMRVCVNVNACVHAGESSKLRFRERVRG